MTSGANTMPRALMAPKSTTARKVTVVTSCHASRRRSSDNRPENTGMKAALNAVSATRVRIRLGTLKATVKAPIWGPSPR